MLNILIVDDHELFRDGLGLVLQQLDEQVQLHCATTLEQALTVAQQQADLDLILLDFQLPDGDGIHLLKAIKPLHPATPLVLLSGTESSRLASQALAAGASGFIPKSVPTADLQAAVQKVLDGQIYLPMALYQEDGQTVSTVVNGQLLTLDPQVLDHNPSPVLIFTQANDRLLYANAATARCMGNGWATVGISTLEQCLHDPAATAQITRQRDAKQQFEQIKIIDGRGNPRWVSVSSGPVVINGDPCTVLFLKDISELVSQKEALSRLAHTDPLTGVHNRRGFFELAVAELQRAGRFQHPFCLLIMDLDHFKQVNDHDGHAAGDELLRRFALHCRKQLRPQDLFGRFGGEEFLALLVHTDLEQGTVIAERLRSTWDQKVQQAQGAARNATVSIGMVPGDDQGLDLEKQGERILNQLVEAADRYLYDAKSAGRNQTAHP